MNDNENITKEDMQKSVQARLEDTAKDFKPYSSTLDRILIGVDLASGPDKTVTRVVKVGKKNETK